MNTLNAKKEAKAIYSKDEDKDLIAFMNTLGFLTGSGSFLFALYDFFVIHHYLHGYLSLMITVFYFGILVFNYLGYYRLSRLHFLLVCPLWPAIATVLIGGNISQGMVACTTLVNVFILFDKSITQYSIIAYNILLYVFPRVYVNIFDPILGVQEVEYEEIVVFLISLAWLYLVIQTYENRVAKMIVSLQQKNSDLEQKTLELERFNHIASHDLKSPLRSIISFISLIQRDIQQKKYDKLDGYFEFVKKGANQMHRLIEGVLELSTISSKAKSQNGLVDLNKIINTVKINLQSDITDRKAIINTDELPHYPANEADMIILFQNLIQNGIKYNKSKPPVINIQSERSGDHLILRFTDNGIGIAPEFQEQVFDFFARLHTAESYEGTGLGLGIVKKLVEKYKGTISIDSVVDEYTTFEIRLPYSDMN